MKSKDFYDIFSRQIAEYHTLDSVDAETKNPYKKDTFEWLLWEKSFIDTVQWHLEDLVRPDDVDPVEALRLKRWIDRSNQKRTDTVERIDDWYVEQLKDVAVKQNAKVNTETPAWAIDRLSILALKIYHFEIEVSRQNVSPEHHAKCEAKYNMLQTQREDLSTAIDELLEELARGEKRMVVYRQMKMYNDPSLNPMLYNKK